MKYKYESILGLITLALVCSIIITALPQSQICDPNAGCNIVLNSSYSHILGIKNSYLGIAGFGIIFFILLSHIKNPTVKKKRIILGLIAIGALLAVIFLSLQIFVLKHYCKYCLITDISAILSFVIILTKNRK